MLGEEQGRGKETMLMKKKKMMENILNAKNRITNVAILSRDLMVRERKRKKIKTFNGERKKRRDWERGD